VEFARAGLVFTTAHAAVFRKQDETRIITLWYMHDVGGRLG